MKHIQTHEFLGITKDELTALRKVRKNLANGKIGPDNFHMSNETRCIGGWMEHYGCKDVVDQQSLQALFFPLINRYVYIVEPAESVTMAKKAIDRFLMGMGEKCWAFES